MIGRLLMVSILTNPKSKINEFAQIESFWRHTLGRDSKMHNSCLKARKHCGKKGSMLVASIVSFFNNVFERHFPWDRQHQVLRVKGQITLWLICQF